MELYVSTDVETDGPIPGPNSMLSLGSVAFAVDRTKGTFREVSRFSQNLLTLPGAAPDPKTAAWWQTQPAAYAATREDTVEAGEGMKRYQQWLDAMERTEIGGDSQHRLVFVGYPAGFDFLFVYWYLMRFTGRSNFSFSALDIKTFAMARLGFSYRDATKKNMPKRWFGKTKHNHVAVDDAAEQGELFCRMLLDTSGAP